MPLVCSLRIADGIRVLLGEEGHSDSDFLLIFSYDRPQNGNEILFLLGISLIGYVPTELAQEIDVVHEAGSPKLGTFSYKANEEWNTAVSVWYRTEVVTPGHGWAAPSIALRTPPLIDLRETDQPTNVGGSVTLVISNF